MARFDRITVAQTMGAQGMVPLFYHPDLEICKQVVKACYQGGARLLEFTNRGDFAHEVFGALNKYCAKELPEMILGVGSVTDAGSTSLYLQLGANCKIIPWKYLRARLCKSNQRTSTLDAHYANGWCRSRRSPYH